MSERAQRMVDGGPDYYQESFLYKDIQSSIATELDNVDATNEEIRKQLRILTATWGLKYWEEKLKIPTNEADSYDIRRSRVLSKWRGFGQFSAALIESVAEAFSGGDVNVTVDIPKGSIIVKFVGKYGVPPNLDDLKAVIDNIVHAHLGVEYEFSFLTWDQTDALNLTWDQMDALNLTWDEFETYKP
ncbi:putative phage tail protein [Lysinibacillus sp. 54212]|uniref:putative phage tail protein n=1 Tax=Lysinibacillus sp. 54212 TaxID=3119829 RepID=UPI002FC7A53A